MIRIENVTILKVMTFFVIGNYSVMFLLQKNAPRGCREFEADLSALFMEKSLVFMKLQILSAAAVQE